MSEEWRMVRPVLLVAFASGCAFGMTKPAANRPRGQRPECSSSKSMVGLDAAASVAALALTLGLSEDDNTFGAVLAGGASLVYAISAIRGYSIADDCDEANAQYAREMSVPDAPEEYRDPIADRRRPAPIDNLEIDATGRTPSPPTTQQPVQPPPVQQPPPAQPPPKSKPPVSDWDDFWTEVP